MKQVTSYQAPQRTVIERPNKGSGQKIGTAIGTIGGAVAGGAVGGWMGATAGAGAGATVGGIGGGFFDKDKAPIVKTQAPEAPPIETTENPMRRRMMANQEDSLTTLGNGLASLQNVSAEYQQKYGPQIFNAYVNEYNKRYS